MYASTASMRPVWRSAPPGRFSARSLTAVYIQQSACNGCRACVSACPFGVIHMGGTENAGQGTAKKCTLCYDRLQNGLQPACATACPTASIQFGPIAELKLRAQKRVAALQAS